MDIKKKGFTLIELLIVIGIIGILATAVIVVLNPAELLAQARDGTRLSDVSSINAAINLYLGTYDDPDLNYGATGTVATVASSGLTLQNDCPFSATCEASTSTATDGTGWVRVRFDDAAGGSPLTALPLDPSGVNDDTYFYAFASNDASSTFEINAVLESARHSPKMGTDGGNSPNHYEKGTEPGLDSL